MTEGTLNMYKKDQDKENGRRTPVTTKTKNDQSTKNQDTKVTGADNAEHLTGPDNTYSQIGRLPKVQKEGALRKKG